MEPNAGQARIQWTADTPLTDKLVTFLLDYPADCHILFYDNKGTDISHGRPSGKDKSTIYVVIAKHIFEDNNKYSAAFAANPAPFSASVGNHLSMWVSLSFNFVPCTTHLDFSA